MIPLIGGKALHTYGLLAATGFLIGLVWVRHESKRLGLPVQKIVDLFFYIVASAIIFSRVLYVVTVIPNWWSDPLVFFKVWEGGLIFYGGLIGAVVTSLWYCRKHHLSFFTVADVFSPGIALGHVFGRLGCFAAGCCYGREAPADALFSVVFPKNEFSLAPAGHPLYPTQLFEASVELAIFFFLFFFRKRKKFEGEVFLLYIILYPAARAFMEIYREDEVRGALIGGVFSISQIISFLWLLVALVVWLGILRRRKAGGVPAKR